MAQYIATMRPVGVLGDGLDSSYEEGTSVSGLAHAPAADVALEPLAVVPASIAFLRLYARVAWYWGGLGPLAPQAWLQWRTGGGAYGDGAPELPPGTGELPYVVSEIGGDDIDSTPTLAAWSVAAVNALGVRGVLFADDQGTGDATFVRFMEVWVEVWGEPGAGEATGVAYAVGTAAVEVGSGEVAAQATAQGTAGVEVGGGEVTATATGEGTAGVEVGLGWV